MAQATLCMTFDDNYVDSWYGARALFAKYGVHATFMLCWPERITAKQRDKLHALQDLGHEIGFHTRTHVRLPKYLQTHTLEDYLSDEIDRGLDAMHALDLSPTSFSFPYFRYRPKLIDPLLSRFDILRLQGPYDDYKPAIAPHGAHRTLDTFCFTDKTGLNLTNAYFADRFRHLAQTGGIAVSCGHFIGEAGNKFARVRCSHDDLESILALASAHGFDFARLSEVAKPQNKTLAIAS